MPFTAWKHNERDGHRYKNEYLLTLTKTEIIYSKNVGALVAMNFT